MAFIQKLMLRGVRSFSPREANTVEFHSPLTLIVGANGTGKTTIIEALRYATTGCLPPNSRGGAFVHDPKIARETEVRAQVMMLFTNVANKRMVCSRSLQLTQRKEKTEQRTLESVLWVGDENGDGGQIGGRCTDVDGEMPRQLGVSGSVLESVIFCHQEESTWPLGEPVAVKRRFDEIFASTRYSKALESLKTGKKECGASARAKTQELEFLRKMVERRGELEMRVRNNGTAIERNEEKLRIYEKELGTCEKILGEVMNEMERMEMLEKKVYVLAEEEKRLRMDVDGYDGENMFSIDEALERIRNERVERLEKEYEENKAKEKEAEDECGKIEEKRNDCLRRKQKHEGMFSEISVKSALVKEVQSRREEHLKSLERELGTGRDFRKAAMCVFRKVEEDVLKKEGEVCEIEERWRRLKDEEERRIAMLNEKIKIVEMYEGLIENKSVDVEESHIEDIERLEREFDSEYEIQMLEGCLENWKKRLIRVFESVNRGGSACICRGEDRDVIAEELRNVIEGIGEICLRRKDIVRRDERREELKERQKRVEEERIVRMKIAQREETRKSVEEWRGGGRSEEIEECEREIERRRAKLERLRESFSKRRMGLEMEIEEMERKNVEIEKLHRELEILEREVGEYRGEECTLKEIEEKWEEARRKAGERRKRVVELWREVCCAREERKRAEESIRFHESRRRIEEIEEEKRTIDMRYLNELREKKKLLEEKRTGLISQRSLLLGECKQIAIGIKSFKAELERDHGNCVENYNRCIVEMKALEMSCDDLERCVQLLDKAIVEFHFSKLEEVNARLKELWCSTYRGNDVDWIEICAESVGNKTYNYRVVLVKNGVELDMRGRSSAGQRMIASILIRLALAESFAGECNVLALDEPTTNLDRENVEGLAFTISRIISRHRGEKSFQLIVITHDEDFVQLLGREGPEYFYRLSRNENGDSSIVRHSLCNK